MSNSDFVKGECRHCAGHLEFPADAIGQTIACPHCGLATILGSPSPKTHSGKVWPTISLAALLLAGAAAVVFWIKPKAGHGGEIAANTVPILPKPPATTSSNAPSAAVSGPEAVSAPKFQVQTNDFGILPFKLQKTPGSSLVYIVGTVRNLSDNQRFGVKIVFNLLDAADNPVGTATDYQSVLGPHADWRFKALVMDATTASARYSSITEDK